MSLSVRQLRRMVATGALLLCACALAVVPIALIMGRELENSSPPHVDGVLELEVGALVIDTDAGGDDAVSILIALGHEERHPTLRVVAITCVVGNTAVDNVVVNVFKTLDTVNRLDIPVYRGAHDAIRLTPESDNFYGLDGFGDFEYLNPPDASNLVQKEHAAQALIRLAADNPGNVTVLCIGPLTNIALAIRLDPHFLGNLKQLVVMGGSVEGFGNVKPGVEFNFFSDPDAAFIVFNSTDSLARPVVLLPWESVTVRNIIPIGWRLDVLGKLGSPQTELINKAEAPVLGFTTWPCADAVAAGLTANPGLVTAVVSSYLQVGVDGVWAGAAYVDYSNAVGQVDNVIIIKSFDVEAYKSMLLQDLAEKTILHG